MAEQPRSGSIGADRKRSSVQLKVFLCVMGSVISLAICAWIALLSKESGWRKVIFAGGAAACSVSFACLAAMTFHRAKHPPEPEPLPDLSQRRSTIGARVSKRSIAAAGLHSDPDCPTQVLVVGEKSRPSLTVA